MRATVSDAGCHRSSARWRRLHDAPAFVDDDAVAETVGLGEVVRDDDRGRAQLGERRAQLVAQGPAQRHVERGERLVEQEQRGVDGERAAERHALALTARELGGSPRFEAAEAEPLDDFRHLPLPRGTRLVAQTEPDVLRDVEMRKQRVALEDVADAAPLRRQIGAGGGVEEDTVVEHDAAGVGAHEAGQTLRASASCPRPTGRTAPRRRLPPSTPRRA